VEVAAARREVAFHVAREARGTGVGLDQVIDVEVAPSALGVVDDPEDGVAAGELGDVPRFRRERFAAARLAVRAGGCSYDLAVDEELKGELLGVAAAADQEGEELPFDAELGGSERAGGVVALEERVHEALALEPVHGHLPWKRPARRSGPEGLAGDGPTSVGRGFKVREHDVLGGHRAGSERGDEGDGDQGRAERRIHRCGRPVAVGDWGHGPMRPRNAVRWLGGIG